MSNPRIVPVELPPLSEPACPFQRESQAKPFPAAQSACGAPCGFPILRVAEEGGGRPAPLAAPCGKWALHLSFNAFAELMLILEEKQLPCIVSVVRAGFERWHGGAVLRVQRDKGRLELAGGGFALSLKESQIGTIALVGEAADAEAGPAVALFQRGGGLLARVQSLPDPDINARWREIMCCRPDRLPGL